MIFYFLKELVNKGRTGLQIFYKIFIYTAIRLKQKIVIKISGDINNKDIEEIPEIKKYFMRIYTVLSKDIRDRLKNLNLPKEKKKKIRKELAFLSKKKQIEYLDELN